MATESAREAARDFKLTILSDVHYAGAAEQARGDDYEFRGIRNPLMRYSAKAYRHFIWMRHPLQQGRMLDRFLTEAGPADHVVANGDFACNTNSLGVSDDATLESAKECLGKLRAKYGDNFHATFGDHELGKVSMFGGRGGMMLTSWHRGINELGLKPFWRLELGNYVLMGVASSLIALPVFLNDTVEAERPEWDALREKLLSEIRAGFASLRPDQRVLLFCHDPTALPFLWLDDVINKKLPQVEQTIIGHLHTKLILWKSKLLAGMPTIGFMGHSVKRMSKALNDARCWQDFHVRLCPALAGTELLNDGGYLVAKLDGEGKRKVKFEFKPLKR